MAEASLSDLERLEHRRRYKRDYARKWRAANPDKRRAAKKRAYDRNPQYHVDHVKRWRLNNPDKFKAQQARRPPSDREWSLKKKYGLTIPQWDALFVSQGSVCAACGTDKPGTKNGWHTDHCHETGKVRGILCLHCNVGIGKAKDSVETMRKWIVYIERHSP